MINSHQQRFGLGNAAACTRLCPPGRHGRLLAARCAARSAQPPGREATPTPRDPQQSVAFPTFPQEITECCPSPAQAVVPPRCTAPTEHQSLPEVAHPCTAASAHQLHSVAPRHGVTPAPSASARLWFLISPSIPAPDHKTGELQIVFN